MSDATTNWKAVAGGAKALDPYREQRSLLEAKAEEVAANLGHLIGRHYEVRGRLREQGRGWVITSDGRSTSYCKHCSALGVVKPAEEAYAGKAVTERCPRSPAK